MTSDINLCMQRKPSAMLDMSCRLPELDDRNQRGQKTEDAYKKQAEEENSRSLFKNMQEMAEDGYPVTASYCMGA